MSGKAAPPKTGRPLVALTEVYRARVTLQKRSAAGGLAVVLPSIPHLTDAASLVASAHEAYLRGDFPTCVSTLEGLPVSEGPLRAEAIFILARAMMRLRRYGDVVALLEPTLEDFVALEEICTARFLYGAAVAYGKDVEHGLELLAAAAVFANSKHVHHAIRGEIAYFRSVAYWTKRNFAEAMRYAIQAEQANLDVLSVRATQIRAFTALSQGKYQDALRLFESARDAYKDCRGRDIDLATQIVCQIANLEMTLRSAAILGSHRTPNARTIPGTSFGPVIATSDRMALLSADAWLYALDGDRARAVGKLLDAINMAPDSSWRVWALSSGATLSAALAETGHARCLADESAKLAGTIDWNATIGEQRIGLLRLAEANAATNPSAAPGALALYDSLTSKMDPTRAYRETDDDPRLAGWDAYVRGLVARVLGDHESSADWLRKAVDHFTSCGYLWRAALALIELDATPVDTSSESPLERAAVIIRDNFPESFLAARLGWARLYLDPIGRMLTPAQVDVLRRMLENKSVTVIASETNRAESTVRKHIEAVQAAFGTHSIAELVLECVQRGIVPKSMTAQSEPAALLRTS